MASSPNISWQTEGEKVETVTDFIFLDSKITVDGDCRHEIKRCLLLRRKAVTNSFRPCIKKQRYHFADRSPYSQSSGFSSSHVRRRSDVFEMWCWTGLESPLDSKDMKPVNPKGNQYWIFVGRTDAEAEAPILWPPDVKSQLIGKDWGQEEKRETENEMVGWHHRLSKHEFEQTLEDSEGQGRLECCSPCGCKTSDMT